MCERQSGFESSKLRNSQCDAHTHQRRRDTMGKSRKAKMIRIYREVEEHLQKRLVQ